MGLTESAPESALTSAAAGDEVLYRNDRTLVVRRAVPEGGSRIIKQGLGADSQARLRNEATILRRLKGIEGVVQLAAEPSGGCLELQDAGLRSLSQRLATARLAVDDVIDLALPLAETLADVHRAGVIHKDINPANIVIDGPSGRPVLIDFNIASCVAEERLAFTHQRDIIGTLAYMPPEQTGRTGRPIDHRSDLYALGVTLYEMATGSKPFESDDLLEMIHDHLVRAPQPPVAKEPRLPQALSDIILRLLEKEADRRYQSADGLARDLLRLRERRLRGDDSSFPLGLDDFAMRLTPPCTLVGRKAELQLLGDAIERAAHGEGRALLISGAPGVGKTALINELQPLVSARRGWFVSGKFEQYQRDTTSAFVQALRALGRLLLAEPEAELALHRERIAKALGANLGLGPSLLPEFAVLLGSPPPVIVDDPVEAECRMIQATVDMLKSVASPEHPLVIVVDDIQWAPGISLRFMDALMTQGHELQGLLVVGAYRAHEVDPAHPLHAMLKRWAELGVSPPTLELQNLPPADLGTLIGEMLRMPDRDSQRLAAAVIERTAGNPYDTVELINALRHDGLLQPRLGQWVWSDDQIRHYVGDCDVVGLLGRRIDGLPTDAQHLLELLACLGGDVTQQLLATAAGLSPETLDAQLAPALEDGLVATLKGHEIEVRFRHDRVQQAMHERLQAQGRAPAVQLALARRLAVMPRFQMLAAKQYLPTHELLIEPGECREAVRLFRNAATLNRVINYDLCERFLQAALTLTLRLPEDDSAREHLFALRADRHAALYGLGRLDEADREYEALVASRPAPLQLVDAATVQLASLGNRSRHKDGVNLGLALLRDLGLPQPDDLKMAIGTALFKMAGWIAGPDKANDIDRPEVNDPRVLAVAKVLSKTQVAAFFCAAKTGSWLTMESHDLWTAHGPCQDLMSTLCSTPLQLIAIGEDYQGAYTLARHLLTVGEARRYEPATSVARFMFAISTAHWFEPIENKVHHYRKAREGLLQAGELQYAIFTFDAWNALFETGPTLDSCLDEIQGAFALSARSGDRNFLDIHVTSRQLYRTLHGDIDPTLPPGSFDDADFNEATHEAGLSGPSIAGAYYHIHRATSAALFNDLPRLERHAAAGLGQISRIPGYYYVFRAHLLQSLALCQRLVQRPTDEQAPVLADIDKSLKWMTRRAKDAPANFAHLVNWIEAERAWATGDLWNAARGFHLAMELAGERSRPWHQALITERHARFHLAHGMEATGLPLLRAAVQHYDRWGAAAKVIRLLDEFPTLRQGTSHSGRANGRSTIVSTDMVDVLSVLRASQALSSETSLGNLIARVGKVLGAMTGATTVRLAVKDADCWQLHLSDTDPPRCLPLDEAVAQSLVPLVPLRYVERTREPLLLHSAERDERFNRDPYFDPLTPCAMLLVPILSQASLRAVLVLENRDRRGAFSSDRLDTVTLIAGQLSVSLDNALLYASLERKVAARTAELEEANRRLELLSTTDALTGVANRRKFNETLDAEWLRARRTGNPIGLVMIDIDHFKLYNDHYGHQGGDTCLELVARTMRAGLRAGSDLIARYGGEEFVLLLPNTDLAGTRVVAERVRAAIEALREPHVRSTCGIVTISVGITSFVPSADAPASLHVERADQALYDAKRLGRNRVETAGTRD